MKLKFQFTLAAVFSCFAMLAQPLQSSFHYRIGNGWSVMKMPEKVRQTYCGSTTRLKAGVTQKEDTLLIDFWGVPSSTCSGQPNVINELSPISARDYYYITINPRTTLGNATRYISLPFQAWEVGLLTIPVKYRLGKNNVPNDASAAVNGGIYVGRKWGHTRFFKKVDRTHNSWAFTAAGFFGPSAIALEATNTNNEITTKTNELFLGLGAAILFSYRDIQLGLLGGYDLPGSRTARKWNYDDKPWIGFGLGYKIGIFGAK